MKNNSTISFLSKIFRKELLFALFLFFTPRAYSQCNASFNFYSGSNPDSVHFYPTGTAGSFYYWNFGDGTTSTSQYPWHFFTVPGTYNVCLTINVSGTYCTSCDSVTVLGGGPCNAQFVYYHVSSNPDSIHYGATSGLNGYSWNFGDGSPNGTGQNVFHEYTAAGTYTICLTVNDAGNYCTWCDTVHINGSSPCNASFVHYSINNPDSVHFYPTGSTGAGYWSFGDGTTSTVFNPWHYYTSPGTYYVCHTVNNGNSYCTSCDSVTVTGPPACNADFSFYTINNPDSVHFYPTGSTTGSNYWTFGDGTNSTSPYPWHYYTSPGTYYVCHTMNVSGTYCTSCDSVTVVGSTYCNAAFSFYAGNNPDSLHFYPTGSQTGNNYWTFGDGTNSTEQYPWHHYTSAGTYYVCHTMNVSGTYCTSCDSVTVEGGVICDASFSYYTLNNPDSIHFYSTGSVGNNYWSFGDGTTSSSQYPWHFYSAPGTYYVCHYVNVLGTYCTQCDSITIAGPSCNTHFSHYSLSNPDSVHFYPTGTSGSFYYWNFGDGTTSTEMYPWHHYTAPGTYNVCLTINISGNYCTWCDSVTVTGTPPPPCDASYNFYSIGNPDSLHFYPTGSTGGTQFWNFGDGTTSTQLYPWHEFTDTGTYNVCHTVYINGVYCTYCMNVVIQGQNIFYNLVPPQSGPGFQFNPGVNEFVSTPETGTISIYPNPVNNEFFVVLPVFHNGSSVVIIDLLGRKVHEEKLYSPLQVIQTGDLSAGVYFVSVTDGKTVTVNKISVIK